MRSKPGLTLDRHREIGVRLKTIRDELMSLSIDIGRVYPLDGKVGRAASRLYGELDKLRCALDDAGFIEHGDDFSIHVYYGRGGA